MANKLSPMMTFYLSLKEDYKDCIVLFRLGDFYEMFFDDAVRASKILDLTLTGRDCGLDERAPMCGVPFHAVDGYIAKLISAGEKVAICEQLTTPAQSKGMVERGVVRVITPGTIIDSSLINEKSCNYIASIYDNGKNTGIAWLDITTGEFNTKEFISNINIAEDILNGVTPSEIICNEDNLPFIEQLPSIKYSRLPKPSAFKKSAFDFKNSYNCLIEQFSVQSLQIYDCEDKTCAVIASGALMQYVLDTQKRSLTHINNLSYRHDTLNMYFDANTRRNLELTTNNRDGKKYASVLWVLDKTRTNMGARELKKWVEQPLLNDKKINDRLNCVEEFIVNNKLRTELIEILDNINDIGRFAGRISYDNISPKDLYALALSLQELPKIKNLLTSNGVAYLKKLGNQIDPLEDISNLLIGAIDKDAGNLAREGRFIRDGFNTQLDEYRNVQKNGVDWVREMEVREREATGIKNLKISYNKVFGYYIEITKSMLDKVPFRYVRKQTLANCERYITEELKKFEDLVLSAEEKSLELELQLFKQIKESLSPYILSMQNSSTAIAICDALISLAIVARENNYVKPTINNKITDFTITMGRHPVVEKILGNNKFIPNDTLIDCNNNRTMIITGPNMAGKSTYMRQVAIITILAHIGSFVPAKIAEIPITDRIFTRIGASDDLAFGQSTFMVEMIEVATIVKNATDKSLLILDEIGRGTSTCDGLAIAWAVIEFISKKFKAKTLFSTHYHELTQLEGLLEGVRNYKILVSELDDKVIFTHRIARGGANKSFGIEVAEIAGVPNDIILRAKEISAKLENNSIANQADSIVLSGLDGKDKKNTKQMSFLSNDLSDELADTLIGLDTDNITPIKAIIELSNLKELARRIKDGKN